MYPSSGTAFKFLTAILTLGALSAGYSGPGFAGELHRIGEGEPPARTFTLDRQKSINRTFRISVRENNLATAKEQIALGAQVNSRSDRGKTALMFASERCYSEIASWALSLGADPALKDKSGRTALMYASRGACLPIARALLHHSPALRSAKDRQGRTAAYYAQQAAALAVDGPALEVAKLLNAKLAP